MANKDNTKSSRKSSKNAESTQKQTQANADVPVEAEVVVKMCILPEENLRAVYDWLEGEAMTMPHNQVMRCLQLLGVARILEDKD